MYIMLLVFIKKLKKQKLTKENTRDHSNKQTTHKLNCINLFVTIIS